MAARRLLTLVAVSPFFLGSVGFSQSAITVPTVQNSKYQFEGTTNSDAVLVRAGPSDNYYPVARLDKGTTVTVVGITFDWLKIVPPEGSFSYIAKAYVNKTSADRATISHSSVNIRAGSTISPMKSAVQTKLAEGDTVEIIGEQDEYYKIKPPAGAYVYVNKQYVTPGRLIGENPVETPPATPSAAQNTENSTATALPQDVTPIEPTTQEAPPARPPSKFVMVTSDAENKFAELEEKLRSTMHAGLEKQPVKELLAGYKSLMESKDLPATLKRLAKTRIDYLEARLEAQKELVSAQSENQELQTHVKSMQSQDQRLQQELAKQQMHLFTAIGTLQSSSVQSGGQSLYRLVDSDTGRTLVYLSPSNASLAQNLGQMVGVRGEINEDPSLGLKVISPTGVEVLNTDELSKATAQIMPDSMAATTQP